MRQRSDVLLRLVLVGTGTRQRERAELLVDRLAARRRVVGDTDTWLVSYEAGEVSEAMRSCERELAELDPTWLQFLDFQAVRSRLRHGATLDWPDPRVR